MLSSLLLLSLTSCEPEREAEEEEKKSVVQEIVVPESFQLGNILFSFAPDSSFSTEEKRKIMEFSQAAYLTLASLLGEEVLQFPWPAPVEIHKSSGQAKGSLKYENKKIDIGKDLEPHLNGELGKIELHLNEISEENIAHEFVHLYGQGGYFWSQAFLEGLVYGIIHYLYPDYYGRDPEWRIHAVRNQCFQTLFERGWDYHQVDEAYKGGIQSEELKKLAETRWMILWADFIKEYPDFPRRFFELILKERKRGRVDFTRPELLDFARKANPKFDSWLNAEGAAIKEIETQDALFAVFTGFEKFGFVNLEASREQLRGTTYIPGRMRVGRMGTVRFEDRALGKGVDLPNLGFVEVNAPGISRSNSFLVSIDGQEVPFYKKESECTKN